MRIDFNAPLSRTGSRRQSRVVARQHSYDDDIKASTVENVNNKDTGLELPTIPRRYNPSPRLYIHNNNYPISSKCILDSLSHTNTQTQAQMQTDIKKQNRTRKVYFIKTKREH